MARWHKWKNHGTGPNASRRAFLGGAAAMLTLPWMESLAYASGSADPPLRLIFWYIPNGMNMENFVPVDTGANYTISPLLQPIAAHRDKFMVLSNVSQSPGADSLAGDHARGTAAFLTARTASRPGQAVELGPSVDYLASLSPCAEGAQMRSLHLATTFQSTAGSCDSGYACAYQNSITWSSSITPVPPRVDPAATFNTLFGGSNNLSTLAAQQRRHERRLSILDHVVDEANTLRGRISTADRVKLDQFLTNVEELENDTQGNPPNNGVDVCDPGDAPEAYIDYPDHLGQTIDLMVRAVECDSSRVISLMADRSGSYRSFPWASVTEAHHEMSHWATGTAAEQAHRKSQWEAINRWHVQRLNDFLTGLDGIQEANGTTALDNSIIFFSSEIGDGQSHSHHDVPVILAGGGKGMLDTGRHVRYGTREPIANLFLGMLDKFDVPQANFGQDGTRIIPNVFLP